MSGAARSKKILLLLLAVGGFIWLHGLINLNLWQQQLQHKVKQFASQAPRSGPAGHSHLPSRAVQADNLFISNLTLPEPPALAVPATLPKTIASQAVPPLNVKPRPVTNEPPQVTTPQRAEQVYQQLQTAQGLDLQIALPADKYQRNQLLDYFYRCAGVQFAILQQQQLSYLSPSRYMPVSQWLRVANGALSPQEQQWLAGQQGMVIRVFPQSIDRRLSQYIATNLQGKQLSNLRASYRLSSAGLGLSNISLNNQNINNNWLLHTNTCPV